MISTRNLTDLPDATKLKSIGKSTALLDAIIEPEWNLRYFSFQEKFAEDVSLFSMRNGCGDDFHIIFTPYGTIIKGFAHESALSPYQHDPRRVPTGILDDLPSPLTPYLNEPAFVFQDTTFCIWQLSAEKRWHVGNIGHLDPDDGSSDLLFIADGKPETYQQWAEVYYERHFPLDVIEAIYDHKPIIEAMLKALNNKITLENIKADLIELRY